MMLIMMMLMKMTGGGGMLKSKAHPVVGKRVLTLYFESLSATEVSLVIVGNTWIYRDDLEKNGIAGTRSEGGSYIRYVKNVDVASLEGKQQLLALVDIFNKQALRIVVDPEAEEDSELQMFYHELKELTCLHFA